MIDELRALLERGARGPGRSEAMLGAALDHQGLAGSVFVVSLDTLTATNLARQFVTLAKSRGLTGRIQNRGRAVVIDPTRYAFTTLGEDANARGLDSPRFIDDAAVTWAIARLIRTTAGGGPI